MVNFCGIFFAFKFLYIYIYIYMVVNLHTIPVTQGAYWYLEKKFHDQYNFQDLYTTSLSWLKD
jgi:hypothetical protein